MTRGPYRRVTAADRKAMRAYREKGHSIGMIERLTGIKWRTVWGHVKDMPQRYYPAVQERNNA